jgi:choline dehydrogenase-like flavoprotein
MSQIDRATTIAIITDDDVDPRNRVSLSRTLPPDAHGRVPRIDVVPRSRRSIQNQQFLLRQASRILRHAGAVAIHRTRFPVVLGHIHSTLRMGDDTRDSVLDSAGEARFVRRLFVADNSALANALGGTNPTLTTQALATRLSEHIVTRYFGGEPWVGLESPTPSIDHRVTSAVRGRHL